MSLPAPPPPCLLVVAVILSPGVESGIVERELEGEFGPVAARLDFVPYAETKYYEREMGEGLTRGFLAFANAIDPGRLAEIKLKTNEIEARLSAGGPRRVNLDPGAVDLGKLVLPSCKEAAHRTYLGRGVHAEIEYRFICGTFAPLEWTYPDYRNPRVLAWFNGLRETLRKARKGDS